MDLTEVIKTNPARGRLSVRKDEATMLSSLKAGGIYPLHYIPLLREDRVSRGQARFNFDMMETAETLMNPINVTVHAYFVPLLAATRFTGLDNFNRSYQGQPEADGEVTPFFTTRNFFYSQEIYRALGMHAPFFQGGPGKVNSFIAEAYNIIVNHRRAARSTKLPTREVHETEIAEAFWRNPGMTHIVPDFDQAMMDGELELELFGKAPVSGIGYPKASGQWAPTGTREVRLTGGELGASSDRWSTDTSGRPNPMLREDPDNPGFPAIYAELAESGVRLSLANMELAKKTAAFAKIRKQYQGLDDDGVIDMLMEGIRVPDAQLSQPILLDRKSTIVGYNKRHATDGDSLDKSVTTGRTSVDMRFRTPPMNTGGVIMFTAEIVPEQLFERQRDYYLHDCRTVADLPNRTRDELDPEQVDVVPNRHVDVMHTNPDATFGYAPLNHVWQRSAPRIGGKFRRAVDDKWLQDRQRLWAVETIDPELTKDFYLVGDLKHSVFADQESDAFEVQGAVYAEITGNTVFGQKLFENTDDYEAITADIDTDRIEQ